MYMQKIGQENGNVKTFTIDEGRQFCRNFNYKLPKDKKIPISSTKQILAFPLMPGEENHFCILVHNRCLRTTALFDSLYGLTILNARCAENVLRAVSGVYLLPSFVYGSTQKQIFFGNTKIYQKDAVNCGPWALHFFEQVLKNPPEEINADLDIMEFRRKVLNALTK